MNIKSYLVSGISMLHRIYMGYRFRRTHPTKSSITKNNKKYNIFIGPN